jgi:hypothetical protein
MKSLMLLWREILLDRGIWCCASTARDYETAVGRFEHEGFSFFTITLPDFAKDFERGLEQGKVDRQLWKSFSFRKGLPKFLGGFLDLVFDRSTGCLLDNPSIDAIFAVRQITMAMGKIELESSKRRQKLAMRSFVECEKQVKDCATSLSQEKLDEFSLFALSLWGIPFQKVEKAILNLEVIPKHGPGATVDRLSGNQKYSQLEWTQRLEDVFPAGDFIIANWGYKHIFDRVTLLEPGAERPVKVIDVPKTMKSPRIIAIEPTCMQYAQQAISLEIVRVLEEDHYLSPLIGFSDQLANRQMARKGSLKGDLATLDLSEASDRVSWRLVQALFRYHPTIAEGLDATRSRTAFVQGHGIIPLSKYASMGSGLCFPVEAMVFLTIVLMVLCRDLKLQLNADILKYVRGNVRVYGDDIIVPVEIARSVIRELEAFGLKVNSNKSFWTGKFRESCGGDYYDGEDVTVVRIRSKLPRSRRDVEELESLVATRNQFYMAGMWQVTAYMDGMIRKLIPFPCVLPESSLIGRFSFLGYEVQAADASTFAPLVRGAVRRSPLPVNPATDHAAMIKMLLLLARREATQERQASNLSDDYLEFMYPDVNSAEHLERSGRPRSASIKIRWRQPF